MSRLERRDKGRLLGRALQGRHPRDEFHRFRVGRIASGIGELIDALGVGLERLTRMGSLARPGEFFRQSH